MSEMPSSWVLRLNDGGWWTGTGHDATTDPSDAAWFDHPAAVREAMTAVGWTPCTPGWIEPLRVALNRATPAQLALAL